MKSSRIASEFIDVVGVVAATCLALFAFLFIGLITLGVFYHG